MMTTQIPVHEVADFQGNLDPIKLYEALAKAKVTLLGMGMAEIQALRTDYLLRGGRLPITMESIADARPEEPLIDKQMQSLRAFMGDSFVDNNREFIDRAIAEQNRRVPKP